MRDSIIDGIDWEIVTGVDDPVKVIVRVRFSVLHSVKTLALTIIF